MREVIRRLYKAGKLTKTELQNIVDSDINFSQADMNYIINLYG